MKSRLKPKFWHKYKGKSVLVFDDVFSDEMVEAFGILFTQLDYKRRPSFDNELSTPMELEFFDRLPDFPETTDRLIRRYHSKMSDRTAKQVRSHVYCASLRYGDNTQIHRDIDCPDCLTFLYYGNLHWDPAWGGETVFFDDDHNAMYCVNPKPGRLVLFNAQLFHRTGIPLRDCPSHRYGMSVFMRCKAQMETAKDYAK